jgi:uncharacterized UPF0160 family protein
MKKIITHSGAFHADDIMAVALLTLLLNAKNETYEIIRTRDEAVFPTGDYVVDVGGIYDSAINRFDHHQQGGAGARPNGVPYSSIGLVWKHYGMEFCKDATIFSRIDAGMVESLDLGDNGIETYTVTSRGVHPYLWHNIVAIFRPVGKDIGKEDERFLELVLFCRTFLQNLLAVEQDRLEAEKKVAAAYSSTEDKRLLVFSEYLQWQRPVSALRDVLFVVTPERTPGSWKLNTTRDDDMGFKNRKDLPLSWAGKSGADLVRISGVSDARFCHNNRFVAAAGSKEGAIAMAKIALENN